MKPKNPRLRNFTAKRELMKKLIAVFDLDAENIVIKYYKKRS